MSQKFNFHVSHLKYTALVRETYDEVIDFSNFASKLC